MISAPVRQLCPQQPAEKNRGREKKRKKIKIKKKNDKTSKLNKKIISEH
jgi:hypothetical protein